MGEGNSSDAHTAAWSYRLRLRWERLKLAVSETWLGLLGVKGDLPDCDGTGEYDWGEIEVFSRCATCDGVGEIEVCAQCHDSGEECAACGC